MKIKLTIEYAGEAFAGWQVQDGLKTVQGELESALGIIASSLAKKQNVEFTRDRILVTGSGRTDAGVHARGQVASFEWPDVLALDPFHVQISLNGITPQEIVVRKLEIVEDDFDARFSPHVKCYRYHFLMRPEREGMYASRAWSVGPLPQLPSMIRCARTLVGTHDFAAFRASDCSSQTTTRTIVVSQVTRISEDELVFTMCGKGFLKQMIRILSGTLAEVGRGKISEEDFQKIFQSQQRVLAGVTAPPSGLVLEWVRYLSEPYY